MRGRSKESVKYALQFWRQALPGIPDKEIVIPTYYARDYYFPPATRKPNRRSVANYIRKLLDLAISMRSFAPARGTGRNEQMRQLVRNALQRSLRWWNSLRNITPLKLNQSLFSRRNGWKDILDFADFLICYSLCIAWLDMPRSKRNAREAKRMVTAILRESQLAWEHGDLSKP